MSLQVGRIAVVLAATILCAAAGIGGLYAYGSGSEETTDALRFADVSQSVGFNYTADSGLYGNGNSGLYVADVDDDGWQDVLAIGGERPALFLNEGGTFRRSEALPSLNFTVQSALFLDSGSGSPDLLLLPREGRPVYLANDGGEFTRRDVGLDVSLNVSVTASAADYDRDGDLDLFVTQSGRWTDGLPEGYYHTARYLSDDNGGRNYLFERVDGEFERVDAGIRGKHWTLAASFTDFTGDGYPDIHVANDFNSDVVYVNQRDGSFERRILSNRTARNAMSSDVLDVNGDGAPDVFVTNIYVPLSDLPRDTYDRLRDGMRFMFTGRNEGNNLLVNQGDGTFVDRAASYGVREGGWGWAAMTTDFDNDGDRDLIHTTQKFVRVNQSAPTYTYPMVFERDGDRFRRRDASGLGFDELDGRGAVHVDFDRDGDQDVLVAVADGRYRVYENRGTSGGALQVDLVGGERSALGATVEVTVGATTRTGILNAKADYQSQDTRTLHFGVGDHESVDRVVVTWPDGATQTFRDLDANQLVVVSRDGIRSRANFTATG